MDARGINSVSSYDVSSVSSSKQSKSSAASNVNVYELVNNIRTQLALVQVNYKFYCSYRSYAINTSKN